jgi:aquaporin Z
MVRSYIAEAVGTCALSFVVLTAVAEGTDTLFAIPVMAALTVGVFVYTVGPISGTHLNPAITLGLWSVGKIETQKAGFYILAQCVGALGAVLLASMLVPVSSVGVLPSDGMTLAAEALGTACLAFGIASVVYGKVGDGASGLVIGGSLLLGLLMATQGGAAGILNPAVALALGVTSLMYFVVPIVGAVAGFWAYRYLAAAR